MISKLTPEKFNEIDSYLGSLLSFSTNREGTSIFNRTPKKAKKVLIILTTEM
jgi:hypothetical protein